MGYGDIQVNRKKKKTKSQRDHAGPNVRASLSKRGVPRVDIVARKSHPKGK